MDIASIVVFMNNTGSVLALDGTNLLHRTYHAMIESDLRNPEGAPLWALHGLAGLIAKYVDTHNPKWLVITFDVSGSSNVRRVMDPGYKAGRGESHPDLLASLKAAPALFAKAGLSVLTVEEREADDTLAAIAFTSAKAGIFCKIVTADRDAIRLISDTCSVVHPDGRILLNSSILDKYGVDAVRYPELAALVGESSDNLPGVPGIGPKTGAKIVNGCANIVDLLEDAAMAEKVAGARFANLLSLHSDRVKLNLKIATPITDMDVRSSLKAGEIPIDAAKIQEVFSEAYMPAAGKRLASSVGRFMF